MSVETKRSGEMNSSLLRRSYASAHVGTLDKLDCLLPGDYALGLMRERVKILRDAGGVPPNWTGVVLMTAKYEFVAV